MSEEESKWVTELVLIIVHFLAAHDEGPGLIDCIDNDGERYTSQGLADTIERARAALSASDKTKES